jgi:peptidyl-prolyl cis-trans isomerase D
MLSAATIISMTMLDGMRRHKGWLKWSLGLVCLAFVFVYVPEFGDQTSVQTLPTSVLAQVGNHEITVAEFRRIYQRQIQEYRLQAGGELSDELLRSLGVDRQLLQQMIDEYTALSEAERLGIVATDAEVRQRIVSLPAFQESGQFIGEQRYRRVLQVQNPPLSTTEFEEDIRRGIIIERLQAAVTQWVSVSNEEVEDEHRRRNEKVRVNVVAFRGDDYRDEIEVTDADIEEFYENESLVYQVPEKRKLRFLLIDQTALADAITPTEAEIQEYYDFNASRYVTPGRVRASQILLRIGDEDEAAVEARAAELTAQARDGADFAGLVRAHSDDEATIEQGGDLGTFGRGRMVPEVEGPAFAMGVDEVSDPTKSPLGYHVIKVTEKQEELTQPLTEVRETIINTLKQERAAARATALAQAIAAEVSVPEDLDRAAASRGLEIQESAFAGPGEPILGLGLSGEVSSRAFQLDEGEVDGPIGTSVGPAFVTVLDRQDPYVPPLDEVRTQVRDDVLRRRALTLAQERANDVAGSLQEADDFVAAAEASGLAVGSSELLARGGAFPEVGVNSAIEAVAFALPVGGISDVIEAGSMAAIVHVVERESVTPEQLGNDRVDLRYELLQGRQAKFYQAYLANAASELPINIDLAALQEATGV